LDYLSDHKVGERIDIVGLVQAYEYKVFGPDIKLFPRSPHFPSFQYPAMEIIIIEMAELS
jgi:hypothetical protein